MKKRLFVGLLLCILTICLVSAPAFAEGETTPVAKIGDTEYTSLANAVSAAQAATEAETPVTITLLADCDTNTLPTNITVDLNGKMLTYSGGSLQPKNGDTLSFVDSSVTGTERGGTLKLTANYGVTYSILCPRAGGTVNATNIVVAAEKCSAFFPAGDAAAVNVTNCDVTAACYGVGTNAGSQDNYKVAITLKGSNITTTSSDGDNTAVLINVEGTLNIEDCVITGDRQGVVVRAGDATITDSEIVVTGKYAEAEGKAVQYQSGAWNSGNEVPSAAVTVGNYVNGTTTSYADDATVTITNTTVTTQSDAIPAVYVDANQSFGSSVVISGESEVIGEVMKGQHVDADAGEEGTEVKTNDIIVTGGDFTDENITAYVVEGIEVHIHTPMEVADVAATCTTPGLTGKVVCSACGYVLNEGTGTAVDENVHVWELINELKPATHESTGIGKYQCAECKTTAYQTIPVVHTWDDGKVTTEATCTEAGEITYTCTVDGCTETKTETISATGHDFAEEAIIEATCTECAKVGTVCQTCGATKGTLEFVENSEPLGHDMQLDKENDKYKAATCTEAGLDTFKCSRCDATEEKTTEALGHDWSEGIAVEATCYRNSGTLKTCRHEGCDETSFTDAGKQDRLVGQHDYTIVVYPENFDCEQGGTVTLYCKEKPNGCQGTTTKTISAGSHTWDEGTVVTEPTCTTAGSKTVKCTVCGKEDTQEISATGHTQKLVKTLKEATCTTTGIGKYECSVCGESSYAIIEAQHSWNEGEVTTEPTCTEKGEMTFTCTVCSETKTEEIDMIAHDWIDAEYTPATCTENGKDGGQVCSVCGAVNPDQPGTDLGELDPATGHDWKLVENAEGNKAATCTEEGVGTYECTKCGETKTETISATGHTPGEPEYIPATCAENGKAVTKCTVCGEVIESTDLGDLDPKLADHAYELVEDDTYVAPTCGEAGSGTYKCKYCDATKTEVIPATDEHTEAVIEAKEATCKEAGLTEGVKCSVCGKVLYGCMTIDIDPDAHNYELNKTLKEASCEEGTTGIGKYVCSYCGDYYYMVIPADHAWGEWSETPADCGNDGSKTRVCTVCGKEETETISATGEHAWGDEYVPDGTSVVLHECTVCGATEIVANLDEEEYDCENDKHLAVTVEGKEPTCTETGLTEGTKCALCGEILTAQDEIDALGHEYEKEVTTEPTCTEAGVMTYTCTRCGDKYTEEIDALGHSLVDDEAVAATCTADGKEAGKHCENCDYVEGGKTIPATGHSLVDDEAVAATCIADGKEAGKHCENCDYVEGGKTIPATGHSLVDDEAVAATCIADGKEAGKHCENCDYVEGGETIPATGEHTPAEERVNVKEVSETEEGYTGDVVCSVCGQVIEEGEIIPATGTEPPACAHENTETRDATDATCTEEGYTGDTYCTDCNELIEEGKAIPVADHTVVVDEAVEATCGASGKTEGSHCSVCGETITAQEVVPATGAHYYKYVKNADGTITYTCQYCQDSFTE